MAADLTKPDPYADYVLSRVVEATAERAVVEQPMEPEVDNHVKVRHASALYTAAYEAGRRLVLAVLGERAGSVELRLADSEIKYTAVGLGLLTSTAERRGTGWDSLATGLDAGRTVELESFVTTDDPNGKTVATLAMRWAVSPLAH